MIALKIQCGCGQRYAFDVEPIAGRMPGPVACPICGVDGTHVANTMLAERLQPAMAAAVAAPANAPSALPSKPRAPGQLDPDKAMIEARSKIMWGDDAADVTKFLMAQGFTADDAKAIIAPIVAERAQTVRSAGISKIVGGIGMMFVPLIAYFVFKSIDYFPIKLFAAAVAVGLWGTYRVLTGLIMFLSPKSEKGDVSEM